MRQTQAVVENILKIHRDLKHFARIQKESCILNSGVIESSMSQDSCCDRVSENCTLSIQTGWQRSWRRKLRPHISLGSHFQKGVARGTPAGLAFARASLARLIPTARGSCGVRMMLRNQDKKACIGPLAYSSPQSSFSSHSVDYFAQSATTGQHSPISGLFLDN